MGANLPRPNYTKSKSYSDETSVLLDSLGPLAAVGQLCGGAQKLVCGDREEQTHANTFPELWTRTSSRGRHPPSCAQRWQVQSRTHVSSSCPSNLLAKCYHLPRRRHSYEHGILGTFSLAPPSPCTSASELSLCLPTSTHYHCLPLALLALSSLQDCHTSLLRGALPPAFPSSVSHMQRE